MPSFTDSISTGAGCTCSPCNNCWATPSAFLHKQLDVTGFSYPLHSGEICVSVRNRFRSRTTGTAIGG